MNNFKRFVAYLIILACCFCVDHQHEQISLSENSGLKQFIQTNYKRSTSTNSEEEVVQLIAIFRHGAHVDKAIYSKEEYDDYGIEQPIFNLPTYLGNAQAWSYGYYLRLKYSDFFSTFKSEDTFFSLADLVKSFENAKHISCGYMGDYPGWDYETLNDTVIEAIKLYGSCYGCPDETYFPIDDLIDDLLSNSTDDISRDNIHYDDYFLDIDFLCQEIIDREEEEFEELYAYFITDAGLEDEYIEYYDSLVKSSTVKSSYENHFHIPLWSTYYYHTLHNLPDVEITQENLKEIINMDTYEEFQEKFFTDIFGESLFYAKLFDTEIIRRIREHMISYSDATEDDVKKVMTVMVHDNNLAALYMLLTKEYLPGFLYSAAHMEFEIYYLDEELFSDSEEFDNYYVRVYYNTDEIDVLSCGDSDRCPLTRFMAVLKELMVEPLKYCELRDTEPPEKPTSDSSFSDSYSDDASDSIDKLEKPESDSSVSDSYSDDASDSKDKLEKPESDSSISDSYSDEASDDKLAKQDTDSSVSDSYSDDASDSIDKLEKPESDSSFSDSYSDEASDDKLAKPDTDDAYSDSSESTDKTLSLFQRSYVLTYTQFKLH